jgi:hypothetical protein
MLWAREWQGQGDYLIGLPFGKLCDAAADAIHTVAGGRPPEWAAAWLAVRWCEGGEVELLDSGHEAHDYGGNQGYVPHGFTGAVVEAPAPEHFRKA